MIPVWDTLAGTQNSKSQVPEQLLHHPESNTITVLQQLVVHVVAGSNPAQIDAMVKLILFFLLLKNGLEKEKTKRRREQMIMSVLRFPIPVAGIEPAADAMWTRIIATMQIEMR